MRSVVGRFGPLLEDVVLRAAIVVAMASTVFTIFVVPNSVAATPRKVIGGHVMGVAAGSLVAAVIGLPAILRWWRTHDCCSTPWRPSPWA